MEALIKWSILVATVGVVLGQELRPAADSSDIISINNLKDKNSIEGIILRVIKKISDQRGSLPEDFPRADYLRLLSTHHAELKDLGSVELSAEQTDANEYSGNSEGRRFGEKLAELQRPSEGEESTETGNSETRTDYEQYYIPPTNLDQSSSNENIFIGTSSLSSTENPIKADLTPIIETSRPEIEDVKEPEESAQVTDATNVQSDIQTDSLSEEREEFQGYTDKPPQNALESREISDKAAVTQYTSSENDENGVPSKEMKTDSGEGYYQVETPQNSESEKSAENQQDANAVSDQSNKYENTYKFPVLYEYRGPQASQSAESSFVPTKASPDDEIIVMGPTPIDIPDTQFNGNTPLVRVSDKKNASSIETDEKKNKYENVKHTVDFAPSPLVAAFTVQQDDKGIPRNIIPLDYVHSTVAPQPTENPEIVAQRQRELEEKEFILYQQLKSLQQEKYRYVRPEDQQLQRSPSQAVVNQQQFQQQNLHQKQLQQHLLHHKELQRQQEQKRQHPSYAVQNYYRQNYQQMRPDYIQQEQLRQQEYQRQQQYYRFQEAQRQKQQQYWNSFQPSQSIELHKSVDFSVPQYEHNRVHRREPSNYVGNYGFSQPYSVSGQIETLINTAGISSGLPRNTQADLNIVSKILALNHGGLERIYA